MSLKEMSSDELQQLLAEKKSEKDKPKAAIFKTPKRIISFLQDMKITDGPHYCENYVLYNIYCNSWAPRGEKVSITKFSRDLKLFLQSKRKTKSRGFLINKVYSQEERTKAKELSLESQKQRKVSKSTEEVHITESSASS